MLGIKVAMMWGENMKTRRGSDTLQVAVPLLEIVCWLQPACCLSSSPAELDQIKT